MTLIRNTNIGFQDSPAIDAFDRLRTSEPLTLFDSKQLYDKQPLFWDEVTNGTATSVHSTTNASTTMSVSANNDFVIRQTKRRFNYQPGKSQSILCTLTLGATTANVTKRVGLFNSNTTTPFASNYDGYYLEDNGSNVGLVISKNGTPNRVEQGSWNQDNFDGTGPSGINLDWTKSQIFFIDYEWLGVGRVRMGFVIDGILYYAHHFNHANSVTSVYCSTPNHSLRYEIRSTGGSASMQHICSSVSSEGGSEDNGIVRSINTNGTHLDANTENTLYALIGVRLKTTHLDTVVKILNIASQIHTTSDRLLWEIRFNPTVAGTFTYSDVTNSSLQRALGATTNTVTSGTIIDSGFVESGGAFSGGAGSTSRGINNALKLGSNIDGTRDTIILCVKPIAGSTDVDVEGSITIRELL